MDNHIIAFGDIHGHFDQLMDIIDDIFLYKKELSFIDPYKDTFVFLGDYIDGGPDTKKVLDLLISYKEAYPHWKFLMGNHEHMLLDAFDPKHPVYGDYYLWYNQGGKETLDSFKPRQSLVSPTDWDRYQNAIMQPNDLITEKYLDFLKNLDMFYETPEYFFVHGGVHPNISLKEQTSNLGDGSEGTYKYDMMWNRDFIGSKYDWGKKIIFGHTVSKDFKPQVYPNMIGLDTMYHNTGLLTAVLLPEGEFITSGFIEE